MNSFYKNENESLMVDDDLQYYSKNRFTKSTVLVWFIMSKQAPNFKINKSSKNKITDIQINFYNY